MLNVTCTACGPLMSPAFTWLWLSAIACGCSVSLGCTQTPRVELTGSAFDSCQGRVGLFIVDTLVMKV